MPVIKSEYECPTCASTTGTSNQILANAGELICSANPAHKWNDAATFNSLNPRMVFKVAPPSFPPQTNRTPITLSIGIGVKAALDEKFAGKLNDTLASLLMQMVEGEIMIVGETDLERMKNPEFLGTRPKTPGELVGLMFAKTQEAKDAKLEADAARKDVAAYEGLSRGRVVIDLGDQYADAVSKAKEADKPLAMWAADALRDGIKDNWF